MTVGDDGIDYSLMSEIPRLMKKTLLMTSQGSEHVYTGMHDGD